MRPCIDIVFTPTWYQMDMEMWNRLTRALPTSIKEIHPFISAVFNQMAGYLSDCTHKLRQSLILTVKNTLHLYLWNNKHVSIDIICRIHKCKSIFILINLPTRIYTIDQTTENTVFHSIFQLSLIDHSNYKL